MINFKYEDSLPKLSDNVISEIYRLVENSINSLNLSDNSLQLNSIDKELLGTLRSFIYNKEDSLGFPMDTATEHFNDLASFDFLPVSDIITDWVKENITPTPALVTIQVMQQGSIITPHVDEERTSVYNFLLETGGGITKFYKNSKEYMHLTAYPQTVFTHDRLEEVESIDIEKNRWHYLNVSKIHNVENIQPNQKRIALSLSYV